jgi:hypothetical protein
VLRKFENEAGLVKRNYLDDSFRSVSSFNSPEQVGAKGDGVSDDTNFVNLLISTRPVYTYRFGGVVLSNAQVLDLNYARAVGFGLYLVRLTNFASVFSRCYISDASLASVAVDFATSTVCRFTDSWIINSQTAIRFAPGVSYSARCILSNVLVDTYTGDGVNVGANTSEINAVNIYLDSGIDVINVYPKRGTNGWRQNTPLGAYANGGHLLCNVTTINCETGFYFTDSQLSCLVNCIADGTAGYGLKLDGACSEMDFQGLFVGTSQGVYVGGSSSGVTFSGLKTILTGVRPPWSSNPNFFLLGAGPFYDVTVADTAVVKIDGDSWRGRKQVSVASGASLNVTGGERIEYCSTGTVPAATTTYLADKGQQANENDALFRMPFDGYIFSLDAFSDGAPGAAQTFTYIVRAGGVATALSGVISGAGSFSVRAYPATAVFATKGTAVSIQLATSAGAASQRHSGNVHILGV